MRGARSQRGDDLNVIQYHTPVRVSLAANLVIASQDRVVASAHVYCAAVDWRPEFDRDLTLPEARDGQIVAEFGEARWLIGSIDVSLTVFE